MRFLVQHTDMMILNVWNTYLHTSLVSRHLGLPALGCYSALRAGAYETTEHNDFSVVVLAYKPQDNKIVTRTSVEHLETLLRLSSGEVLGALTTLSKLGVIETMEDGSQGAFLGEVENGYEIFWMDQLIADAHQVLEREAREHGFKTFQHMPLFRQIRLSDAWAATLSEER